MGEPAKSGTVSGSCGYEKTLIRLQFDCVVATERRTLTLERREAKAFGPIVSIASNILKGSLRKLSCASISLLTVEHG